MEETIAARPWKSLAIPPRRRRGPHLRLTRISNSLPRFPLRHNNSARGYDEPFQSKFRRCVYRLAYVSLYCAAIGQGPPIPGSNRRWSCECVQIKKRRGQSNDKRRSGGFVDGAGWEGVYKILKADGYNVSVVQNPTISLASDPVVMMRNFSCLSLAEPCFRVLLRV